MPKPFRSRNIRISVRLNEQEHKELQQKCLAAGLSIEELVRRLIRGTEIRARPPDSYLELSRQIAAVGNNINQIAYIANSTGRLEYAKAEETLQLVEQIWRLVREAL